MDHYYALIMAGGVGTRLWPLSRQSRPKQVLPLVDERSMFKVAVDRLQPLFDPENVFVVAGSDHIDLLRNEQCGIPDRNFIIEPMGRGTAPAIGLSAIHLQQRDPQAVMAVLTADHFIGDEAGFRKVLEAAYQVAQADQLVTLGITPNSPSTGYGYIERGQKLIEVGGLTAYQVTAFREKPDLETARRFSADDQHSWNSGMFVWKVDRLLQELARSMPEFYAQLLKIDQAWDTDRYEAVLTDLWPQVKSQTIDYGVLEQATDVAVIPAEFGWNDVGSWATLLEILPSDANGNVVLHADSLGIDTTNTLVYGRDRLVATIGLHDFIVVDAGDALLICPKDRAQDVKKIVDQLKKEKKEQYL